MTIYLIRHAQSEFNAVFDAGQPDPMIFDAPITELGRSQAVMARESVADLAVTQVIVSPFTRTLQTAEIIFGKSLPMSINATVREQLTNSCDVGSHPRQLARNYSHLDFDHLDDCWWHDGENDHRGFAIEPQAVLEARAGEFIEYAQALNGEITAVVTHGNFIRAVTGLQPANCEVIRFNPGA